MYTRASPTDILARKSARRKKVRGQVGELNGPRTPRQADCRGSARADFLARRTRRLPREDSRAEVGKEVRVGVRVHVGLVEFKLYGTRCRLPCVHGQIMECTGRCVAVSEPNSPTVIAKIYRKYGDSSSLRELARDVIRWECRPIPSMQPAPLGHFLKLIAHNVVILPLFR